MSVATVSTGATEDVAVRERRIVFLSHATPQENDFVVWLGARLAADGYEVWSDITRLLGGEFWWKDIDSAIRRHAAKVIVCLSRAAVLKDGVLNEIAISVATGKKVGSDEFTLPVRVDDLPFDEFPPQLINRNAIDFSANWADGLVRLLKVLERDGVPRRVDGTSQVALDGWRTSHQQRVRTIVDIPEQVESNWLPVLSMPPTVTLNEIGMPIAIGELPKMASRINWPHFVYARLVGGFGSTNAFQDDAGPNMPLKAAYAIETPKFLDGHPKDGPAIGRREAHNFVASLLRQAWDKTMADRGLASYDLSDGSKVWWVPAGFLTDNKVHFIKPDGRKGWRQLVGRDNPRNVFWHVGFAARPILNPPLHLVLRPHVILTEDGKTPLSDRKKMNALRRGVCKSWFNARWRDLVAGFAQWIGDGQPHVSLMMDTSEMAIISTRPFQFTAPVSIAPEALAAAPGDLIDSSTDDEDVGLLNERHGDPAFVDMDEDISESESDDLPDDEVST